MLYFEAKSIVLLSNSEERFSLRKFEKSISLLTDSMITDFLFCFILLPFVFTCETFILHTDKYTGSAYKE